MDEWEWMVMNGNLLFAYILRMCDISRNQWMYSTSVPCMDHIHKSPPYMDTYVLCCQRERTCFQYIHRLKNGHQTDRGWRIQSPLPYFLRRGTKMPIQDNRTLLCSPIQSHTYRIQPDCRLPHSSTMPCINHVKQSNDKVHLTPCQSETSQ